MSRPPVPRTKRQAIPLGVRYAILCAQCDPAIAKLIETSGVSLKRKYARALQHAVCAISGARLVETGAQFDHVIPLELGGANDASNIQALAPRAHRIKTQVDMAAIAKARRLRGESGQQARRQKHGSRLQSRGFDRTFRKKCNGKAWQSARGEDDNDDDGEPGLGSADTSSTIGARGQKRHSDGA